MARINEENLRQKSLEDVAGLMMIAARTAPKGRGRDNIFCTVLTGEEIGLLAGKMKMLGEASGMSFLLRDAGNLEQAGAVVLMGARVSSAGLPHCGYCGHGNCETRAQFPDVPCAFNTVDLGIALGAAVSVAADHRVDNRIMFSIGKAALDLGFLPAETRVAFGIPLSASAKNPFFDRA